MAAIASSKALGGAVGATARVWSKGGILSMSFLLAFQRRLLNTNKLMRTIGSAVPMTFQICLKIAKL